MLLGIFLPLATDPPPSFWHIVGEVALKAAGYVTAFTVIGSALWWLILPRIKEWLIRTIAAPVQETHKSVTVNGGKSSPPTMLDKIHNLGDTIDQMIAVVGATAQRTSDLADRIDDVHDLAEKALEVSTQTQGEVHDHIVSGEQYLGRVQLVMRAQGIELPSADDKP